MTYLLYCVILFVFAIIQNTFLLWIFEGNLCLSHAVALTETLSHFLPRTGVIEQIMVLCINDFNKEKAKN
jgi:hypothetical protein